MVHCFEYLHEGRPLYFVWDVESGSLHSADRAAFLVCKNRYGSLDEKETAELSLVPEEERAEINGEFDQLEEEGCLNAPENRVPLLFNGEIKALCLHICHDCNLRCTYCFADDGTYDTPRDYMSWEVGKAALDFLFSHSGNRKNIETDFFGGEPLMNFEVVKRLVAYGKEEAAKRGKIIRYTLTTNGVLLNDAAIKFLNEEMDNLVISIDGRPEVHDRLRKTPNGKGSHAIALAAAKKFRAVRGDGRYYIRGTFTRNNLDFSKDVLYINDRGFDQISIEPVVLPESDPLSIRECDLPVIFDQYHELAEEYIKRRKDDRWFNFFHYMIDLENGPCIPKRLNGCGSGKEYVAISPTGDIYPCHRFVGNEKYRMGSVLTGEFDRDMQKAFSEINVYAKEDCAACPAKYYCSGGCAANNLEFGGGLQKPYRIGCEMARKRMENSLAVYFIEHAGL